VEALNLNEEINVLRPVSQNFDWGHIIWLHEPEDAQNGRMMVGHVFFMARKQQGRHLHTGDEQMIYTISGKGEHWVNNKFYPLVPGTVYHVPPYTEHDIRNISDEPLELIIVYNVDGNKFNHLFEVIDDANVIRDIEIGKIVNAELLIRIQKELSEVLGLGILILDRNNQAVTQPGSTADFCDRIKLCTGYCDLDRPGEEPVSGPTLRKCCFNLVRIESSIVHQGKCIGKIICGPVILNEDSEKILGKLKNLENETGVTGLGTAYGSIKEITKGRLYAIMNSLQAISIYIVEMGVKEALGRELHEKTLNMLVETQRRAELEKIVADTKMRLIQSQISPHFLFNTLSVIGELAYMSGAREAADTTFALSNLLRKSLAKSQEMTTMEEEIEYIRDYVFIQNKRFDNLIHLKVHVTKAALKKAIPFMTLQILAENAIKHGFSHKQRDAVLSIEGKVSKGCLVILVKDNGLGMEEKELKAIEDVIGSGRSRSGIGYESILTRLNYYYSDRYELSVKNRKGQSGVEVFLKLRLEEGDHA
jgi:quercetin dioxygenase-like cupin family protein/ligand-binding sensor protein/two-component sensor histidine kinase